MILSMTGFGRANGMFKDRQINVEIKSLNGKSPDIRLKLPNYYKEKELELRKFVLDQLERGKIDVSISVVSTKEDIEYSLNVELFKKYTTEIKSLQSDLDVSEGDILQTVIRIPNVIQNNEENLDVAEWETTKKLTQEAIDHLTQFRKQEGDSLYKDLSDSIRNILEALGSVPQYEEARMNKLKQRMRKNLDEFLGKENVDHNRFEQEVMHYLERLDINEEKVRLEQHCAYFTKELEDANAKVKGRKLGFIGQEIGREINTMGAKAQFTEIQQLVVVMKDNLEKIKEQVANAV